MAWSSSGNVDRSSSSVARSSTASVHDVRATTVLDRTRKYGLFLRFATQHMKQITAEGVLASVLTNADVFLAGGLAMHDCTALHNDMHCDAKFIKDMMLCTEEECTKFQLATGMVGWLSSTGRCELRQYHSRASQYMAAPVRGALNAVMGIVEYCINNKDLCLHQRWGTEGVEWRFYMHVVVAAYYQNQQ